MSDTTPLEAEACAMRLLARRDHSTGELRDKLAQRGFDGAVVEAVLEELVARGWVDDEQFARHQAELLVARGWGPAQLRAKLRKHGVGAELADRTVEALEVDWVHVARERVTRKYGDLADIDRERAYRHLTYRGFAPGTARRAIFD